MIYQRFVKKSHSRLKKRRGITDVISTMMLMAVTITGATTLTYFMNDAFVSGNLASVSTLDSSSLNLLLLAYDTRDSLSLLTLTDVDNKFEPLPAITVLCGASCSGNVNAIPENDGTEFIVIQIQNNGLENIFLQDVSINGIVHSWDSSTSGILLDASQNDIVGGKYPSDGMFSLLFLGTMIQNQNIEIQSGQIVNVLVKLGSDDPDISLNKGIHILLNIGKVHPVEFVIDSGAMR